MAYYSRKLSAVEHSYSCGAGNIDSGIAFVQNFVVYFFETNPRALLFLTKLSSGRLAGWTLQPQNCIFGICWFA